METEKPKCNLVGENGNIFHLMACVCRALRDAGLKEKTKEFFDDIRKCKSYEEALVKIGDYVDIG